MWWGRKTEASPTADQEERIADLTAEIDSLRRQVDAHVNRLNVATHELDKTVNTANKVRADLVKKISTALRLT